MTACVLVIRDRISSRLEYVAQPTRFAAHVCDATGPGGILEPSHLQIKLHGLPRGSEVLSRDPAWFGFPGRSSISARDRKSTRLNSSHMSISYAVFCLKKKITKE